MIYPMVGDFWRAMFFLRRFQRWCALRMYGWCCLWLFLTLSGCSLTSTDSTQSSGEPRLCPEGSQFVCGVCTPTQTPFHPRELALDSCDGEPICSVSDTCEGDSCVEPSCHGGACICARGCACEHHCLAQSVCLSSCVEGTGCRMVAQHNSVAQVLCQGSNCAMTCDAGRFCEMICTDNARCDLTCSSDSPGMGNCKTTCEPGSTCSVVCQQERFACAMDCAGEVLQCGQTSQGHSILGCSACPELVVE